MNHIISDVKKEKLFNIDGSCLYQETSFVLNIHINEEENEFFVTFDINHFNGDDYKPTDYVINLVETIKGETEFYLLSEDMFGKEFYDELHALVKGAVEYYCYVLPK